jgi:hypothetical protein
MGSESGGRPIKFDEAYCDKIITEMEEYMDSVDIPILAEFAYTHNYSRQSLYKHEKLRDTRKKMMMKKEAQLEKLGLLNVINGTMAIFSLKQLGWKDKQEVEHTGGAAEAVHGFLKNQAGDE